jgi:hypothetical protein
MMMRRCVLLLMGLLPLLLLACSTTSGAQLEAEATSETLQVADGREDHENRAYPRATAATWADGFLWTANETGLLTRWDVQAGTYQQYHLPGEPVIHTLIGVGRHIYAGTQGGGIWRLATTGAPAQVVGAAAGTVTALAVDGNMGIWYASVERGLVLVKPGGAEQVQRFADPGDGGADPLRQVSALMFDRERAVLWVGTSSAGLLSYDAGADRWQQHGWFKAAGEQDSIRALVQAADGAIWAASPTGVTRYLNGTWEPYRLTDAPVDPGVWSLAIAGDNTLWAAGEGYMAWMHSGKPWQVYLIADSPLLMERLRFVVLDDGGHPWFVGCRGKVHFDGQTWTAYDADVRRSAKFTPFRSPRPAISPPRDFPSPAADYVAWLKAWPRPEADNGRGMHFLQTHQFDAIKAQKQVNRLRRLNVRWALVHYANHEQLVHTAPIFQEAGITVVWRPFVRPYETYASWTDDVEFLRARGLAPYIQLYNEPSLIQEWGSHPVDREAYFRHLLPAIRQVYAAGGYVGLQFVNPDWLRASLQSMEAEGLHSAFDHLFFVAHLYGLNHPPDYDEDINGVLGFREFAQVFEEEIGFVPVMIAGEGGWRPGEAQDNRYPAISEELHRDYHLAVFNWFRSGELSNGELLPDYLFAFCPWLISNPHDPAAWFDSASGDRKLTIEAVEAMPPFERRFAWDETAR